MKNSGADPIAVTPWVGAVPETIPCGRTEPIREPRAAPAFPWRLTVTNERTGSEMGAVSVPGPGQVVDVTSSDISVGSSGSAGGPNDPPICN